MKPDPRASLAFAAAAVFTAVGLVIALDSAGYLRSEGAPVSSLAPHSVAPHSASPADVDKRIEVGAAGDGTVSAGVLGGVDAGARCEDAAVPSLAVPEMTNAALAVTGESEDLGRSVAVGKPAVQRPVVERAVVERAVVEDESLGGSGPGGDRAAVRGSRDRGPGPSPNHDGSASDHDDGGARRGE